jgi:hypothetical protein
MKRQSTGVERELLTGSDFFDYFTEPQMARVYQEVFAKGSVADSPLFRHKEGKLTDVLFNGSVYKDDQGMSWESLLSQRYHRPKRSEKNN